MNRTRAFKYDKIKEQLDREKDIISLISCNTCTRLAKTGGEAKMKELATKLKEDGYTVNGGFLLTVPCVDSCLHNVKLNPTVNTLLLLMCSCGCSNVETHFPGIKIIATVMDRGTVVEDPVTHRKSFRGTKRC